MAVSTSDSGRKEPGGDQKGVAWEANDEWQAGLQRQDGEDYGERVVGIKG